MLTRVVQLLRAGNHQREVGQVDDALQLRHLLRVNLLRHEVADEKQACLAVIDDVVHLFGVKLM